jgi:hypothetical protein
LCDLEEPFLKTIYFALSVFKSILVVLSSSIPFVHFLP